MRKAKKRATRKWSDTHKGEGTFAKRNGFKRHDREPVPYDPRDEFDEIDEEILRHIENELREDVLATNRFDSRR